MLSSIYYINTTSFGTAWMKQTKYLKSFVHHVYILHSKIILLMRLIIFLSNFSMSGRSFLENTNNKRWKNEQHNGISYVLGKLVFILISNILQNNLIKTLLWKDKKIEITLLIYLFLLLMHLMVRWKQKPWYMSDLLL